MTKKDKKEYQSIEEIDVQKVKNMDTKPLFEGCSLYVFHKDEQGKLFLPDYNIKFKTIQREINHKLCSEEQLAYIKNNTTGYISLKYFTNNVCIYEKFLSEPIDYCLVIAKSLNEAIILLNESIDAHLNKIENDVKHIINCRQRWIDNEKSYLQSLYEYRSKIKKNIEFMR